MTQTTFATKVLRVLLVSTLAAECLYARLGESDTACDVRYNPHGGNMREISKPVTSTGVISAPTSWVRSGSKRGDTVREVPKTVPGTELVTGPNTVTREFDYEGWDIGIGFRDGRAARIKYEHQNAYRKYGAGNMQHVTEEELKAILGANTSGGAWREVSAEQLKAAAGNIKLIKDATRCSRLWMRADGAIAYLYGMYDENVYLEDLLYVQQSYAPPKKPAPKPIPAF